MNERVVIDEHCEREKIPAGLVVPYVRYVIVDERDRVSPAAVSDIIWANPVSPWGVP